MEKAGLSINTLNMDVTSQDIKEMGKTQRLNLINSITGIKPGNLIGTKDGEYTNLAVISSVVHLGSNPPFIGFVMRPATVERHTLSNIKKHKVYTINHIHSDFQKKAHYTSVKLAKEESEFNACELTEEYIDGFDAPFVKESKIKLGMELREIIPIESNGTALIVGEVVHLSIPDEFVDENGYIDLGKADSVGISGLNSYYDLKKTASYPYVRSSEFPPENWDK